LRQVDFERVRRLIQCERLIRLARNPSNVSSVKEACQRAGLKAGDSAIDVGCGPLGALPALAEMVGPAGTVFGVDRNQDVLMIGRRALDQQGLDNVQLLRADINELDLTEAGLQGKFDVAYCRLFLINQRDPVATLRRIAGLVRPGGHIIAHELLDDPSYPSFHPPVPAFGRFLGLVHETMRRQGRIPDVARRFRAITQEAGLEEIGQLGIINANPADAAEFIQEKGLGMLLVFKQTFAQLRLCSRTESDDLTRELNAAMLREYRTFLSWIVVELIARVPA